MGKIACLLLATLLATGIARAEPHAPTLRHGRSLKITGGALIGVGVALVVAGAGVLIYGTTHQQFTTDACAMGIPNCNYSYTDPVYLASGGLMLGLGGLHLAGGIAAYAVGANEQRRAANYVVGLAW